MGESKSRHVELLEEVAKLNEAGVNYCITNSNIIVRDSLSAELPSAGTVTQRTSSKTTC